MIGRVRWFDDEKGYGFIQDRDGNDVFVHFSDILQRGHKTLENNQVVEYDLLDSGRGAHATNVCVLARIPQY